MRVYQGKYIMARDPYRSVDLIIQADVPQMIGAVYLTGTENGEAKFLEKITNPVVRYKIPDFAIYIVWDSVLNELDRHIDNPNYIQEVLAEMGDFYTESVMRGRLRNQYWRGDGPCPLTSDPKRLELIEISRGKKNQD